MEATSPTEAPGAKCFSQSASGRENDSRGGWENHSRSIALSAFCRTDSLTAAVNNRMSGMSETSAMLSSTE